MTGGGDDEVRADVVDLIVDYHWDGEETLTHDQVLRAAGATRAERLQAYDLYIKRALAEMEARGSEPDPEAADLARSVYGPPRMPGLAEGLPLGTLMDVLAAQRSWPWTKEEHGRLRPVFAQWTAQQRAIFEERFRAVFDSVHWEDG